MDLSNAPPTTLGKYQIRGVLGRGAMGTVYDGWDPVIGRRVAIKTVRLLDHSDPEAQEGLERFKREAQAAGRLSHPNIVGVYDYGETEETAYIVMEFVEGQSLKERLDARERFAVAETVRIMEQILAGLQFSHDSGVVHRDIKPGNVMLAKGGRVKLADFGIARIESSVMTQDGTMLGTPAYMSPEQLMAQAVDARSDLYAAGVVLYQLLTGERPFEGGLTAIIHKALNTVPPRPSEISVTAPAALDAVVARAMSKRPSDRYPDADAFARALRDAFEAPAPAPADATIIMAGDDDATLVARPPGAPPPPVAPVEAAVPPPPPATPAPAPSAKPGGGPNIALLGGIAAVVVLLAGGGAWLALRPAATSPSQEAAVTAPPAVASAAPSSPAPPPAAIVKPPAEAPPLATATPIAPPPPAPAPPAPPPVVSATVAPSAAAPAASQATLAPSIPAPAPAPAPAAKPAAEPPVAAIVPPDPAALRSALETLSLSAACAIPRFGVGDDGGVTAAGLVGTGAPAASLHEAVTKAVGAAQLSWLVRPVDGPYCDAFDIVRPLAQPGSPAFGLTLKDDVGPLKDGEAIRPVLKLPDFPAYLRVDYLSHDGSVTHLFPAQGVKDKVFAANATLPLGDAKQGVGAVGPPFGTDVILAIASSVPLFARRRPGDEETAAAYLPALQAAIDAARRANAKITARALVLETVAK